MAAVEDDGRSIFSIDGSFELCIEAKDWNRVSTYHPAQ
jgi:hypothetical protein